MIEYHFKWNSKKSSHSLESFRKNKATQLECAMAILALERIRNELLSMEFNDLVISEDE